MSMVCSTFRCCKESLRHDRRHFHQLVRPAWTRTFRDPVKRDLGHGDNLLVHRGASSFLMNSTTCSPLICGTGSSRICTKGEKSTMCAPVCRRTPGSGRTSTRGVGRTKSTSRHRPTCSTPCLAPVWGGGVIWLMAKFISLSSPLALAIVGLRRAVWCVNWLGALRRSGVRGEGTA